VTALLTAGDDAVRALPAGTAVQAMRDLLASAAEGRLLAPPRVRAELDQRAYVFTVGQLADGTSGFRAYRTRRPTGDQLTAVWAPGGELRGVVIGDELGARRTGALGAVAADLLARDDAASLAVIGAGAQAWTQLWALLAVRALDDVRVYSRTADGREAFARRARDELDVEARAVDTTTEAVTAADIVVLATTSRTPVIDASDIAAGTHVTSLGPKAASGHETPTELVTAAAIVTCDSPAQAASYPEAFFTGDAELVDLAAVLTGRAPGRRTPDEITLHCSVGLAGTEVALAARVLDALETEG
jgi:ornithine cyclodeaminase/alanine dehydrogenase-like protein (mu-crystallin family)